MADLKYWLWLTTRKGLGAVGALAVLDQFSTPERAYYGEKEDFDVLPLPSYVKHSLLDKSLDSADKILGDCDRLGVRIMTFQDAGYPTRLKQIADPPVVLYIKGRNFRFDEEAAIAVVGMRQPSVYGKRWTEKLSMELSANGALVVSGIAEGLDTCAIKGALKGGGRVVSMLAGGVDVPFPHQNRFLYEDVAAAGALISEYPPGTSHMGSHFKPRNRILSGLCLGVLVGECNPWGGTLLTVNHALEQGREVYAVPMSLDGDGARGTNLLIKDYKARLVECAADILEDFVDQFPTKLASIAPLPQEVAKARMSASEDKPKEEKPRPAKSHSDPEREVLSKEEQKLLFSEDELAILSAVAQSPSAADEIVEKTQIPAKRVLSALTMLQLHGVVEEQPGRRFHATVELED